MTPLKVKLVPKTIVITDADSRVAFCCAAAIKATQPATKIVGISTSTLPTLWVFSEILRGPEPHASPQRWTNFINSNFDENALIMPISMHTWRALLQSRPYLQAALASSPDFYTFELLSDKWLLYQYCNIRWPGLMPESRLCKSKADVERAVLRFGWPVILKLRREEFRDPANRYRKVLSLSTLAIDYQSLGGGEIIVQRHVVGESIGVGHLVGNGWVKCFAHRRLRCELPNGGPSTYCERVAVPDAEQISKSLLDSVSYKGIAMLEFIRDPTGRFHLLEVNPRPWGSIQLPVSCGMNFPSWWAYASIKSSHVLPVELSTKIRRLKYVRLDIRAWRSQSSGKHRWRDLFLYSLEYFDSSCVLHYTRYDLYRSLFSSKRKAQ